MKKENMLIATIIGHFGFKHNLLNGQTIKTKNVSLALKMILPQNSIQEIDTFGGRIKIVSLIIKIRKSLNRSNNFIFLLANNGLKYLLPWILLFNKKRKKKLHYVVIGGWLPLLCEKNAHISSMLKKVDYIYVETIDMKRLLEQQGFINVVVMPNFKHLNSIKKENLLSVDTSPYKLCTFSRIMKEKGIEDAIKAVIHLNEKCGYVKYCLDIYGQIEESQKKWFEELIDKSPSYINFKGFVDSSKSVDVIKNYYCLLFPTYYEGEGFAGTILDAMASGVPTIASDWKYNKEIINSNNGVLFRTHDIEDLELAIDNLKVRKEKCIEEYEKYEPANAILILSERLSY